MKLKIVGILLLALILLAPGCDSEEDEVYSPKPRGYIRIPLPEKSYRIYDSICPFAFEIPVYANVVPNRSPAAEPCWLNMNFPQFRATIHLSYKEVKNNLPQYLDDAHEIANKHQIKATGMDEVTVLRDSARVYGLVFDISGNAASSLQFYLTDSTTHFLRGSLYFNAVPNYDSLQIVVDFIKKDVIHLINTAKWKKP